ncbi:cyclase family protein [Methanoculleus sp. FWC-SCC1]|uniref:Cyclase family protein n=1 Tax=Methanoculleus frigidifontis TaxID=2584085 RepID=A0ABT8MDV1_9EURY|nr:cyclase family protein [Methanoculleus sp. FWC-SCC1]MDN7026030.1 cyclase family protein [Methanoculleus sp. FWC-SCC1]
MASDWIDVSVTLKTGMVTWPGDPPVRISHAQSMERGDASTVSLLEMGAHTGTHMDAPAHFVRGGTGIGDIPLDASIGPARVIPIRDRTSIEPDELEGHSIRRGERVLFKTHNSDHVWDTDRFVEEFVYISEAAAQYLAERQVRLVGADYLSVGGFHADGVKIHQTLLNAGIWIIEGLNLKQVPPGEVDLVCLPLKILGGDGAPARALVRPLDRAAGEVR